MRKYTLACWVLIGLCSLPITAHADKPACLRETITAEQPYGTASLYKLIFHVYDAEFWTNGEGWDQRSAYGLHLEYGVDLTVEELLDSTREQLQRQPGVSKELRGNIVGQLRDIYPRVEEGDTITALYEPESGITFCHNGRKTGTITNPEMVRPFFAIWLGKHTSEPEMREELLGASEEE